MNNSSTSFGRVLAAFRAAGLAVTESRNDHASCQAPGHSSADRSVSVSYMRQNGRTLVYPHAGEPLESVLDDIGLTKADLFDESERRYHYPDGRTVVRRYRGHKKSITMPTGGRLDGASLFRAEFNHAGDVYVVEGEESVLAAEACGLNATCSAGGASNAGKSDWTPVHGHNIVIVQDRGSAGADFTAGVRRAINDMVPSIRVVQSLTTGEGDDLVDHLAAGYTCDQLEPIYELTDLWGRPNLAAIRKHALARYCNPLAVLMAVVGRAIAATDPTLRLPPIVGSQASLNMLIGFVAPSGGGKGATEGAARDLVIIADPAKEESIGSGEGLGELFSYAKDDEGNFNRPQAVRRAYIQVTEVDRLTAIASRQGATITAQLRAAWSGEALGSRNRKANSTWTPAHSYRAVVSLGVQPLAAGDLLGETNGTAQRMVWVPVRVDDDVELGGDPMDTLDLALPEPGPHPQDNDENDIGVKEIKVPDCARNAIIEHRKLTATVPLAGRPGFDPLDGHKMLTQLKVAAGLMLLDGREAEMSDEDWYLAGTIMAESDRVRHELEQILSSHRTAANRAKAREVIEREAVLADHDLSLARAAITRWLDRNGPMARAALRTKLKANLRDRFDEAVAVLVDAGMIMEEPTERGTRYRLTEGVPTDGVSQGCTPVHPKKPQVSRGVPGVYSVHPNDEGQGAGSDDRFSASHDETFSSEDISGLNGREVAS